MTYRRIAILGKAALVVGVYAVLVRPIIATDPARAARIMLWGGFHTGVVCAPLQPLAITTGAMARNPR